MTNPNEEANAHQRSSCIVVDHIIVTLKASARSKMGGTQVAASKESASVVHVAPCAIFQNAGNPRMLASLANMEHGEEICSMCKKDRRPSPQQPKRTPLSAPLITHHNQAHTLLPPNPPKRKLSSLTTNVSVPPPPSLSTHHKALPRVVCQ